MTSQTQELLAEIAQHEADDADAVRRAARHRPDGPELMAAEAAGARRFSPQRNRWDDVVAFDRRVHDLEARQAHNLETLRRLNERLAAAPAEDAERLAAWQLAGGNGARPVPTVEALEREVAQAQADHEALSAAVVAVLAEKAAYVEKHRGRLAKDASAVRERAYGEYRDAVDLVAAKRDKLTELRSEELWAQLYPSAELAQSPDWRLVRGGTLPKSPQAQARSATVQAGLTAQVDAGRLLDVLREDADWLNSGAAHAQRAELAGVDQRRPPGTAWAGSPEATSERQRELETAIEAFRQEWNREPTEQQLAQFVQARGGLGGF